MTAYHTAYQDRTMYEALSLLNNQATQPFMRAFCDRLLDRRKDTERRKQMIEELRGKGIPDTRIDQTIEWLNNQDQRPC